MRAEGRWRRRAARAAERRRAAEQSRSSKSEGTAPLGADNARQLHLTIARKRQRVSFLCGVADPRVFRVWAKRPPCRISKRKTGKTAVNVDASESCGSKEINS